MMHEYTESLFENIMESIDSFEEIRYPIYVPSKNRPKRVTLKLLDDMKVNYYLVIEPQDYDMYVESLDSEYMTILVLPENDRGIAYVRNFCKQHSIENSHKWHWQLDDNILDFLIRKDDKNVKYDGRSLLSASEHLAHKFDNVGILGLCHRAFAFTKTNNIDINLQIYSCALIKNSLDINYRYGVVEDTDYSLQVLSKNECTLLLNRFIIDKQTTSTNSGGNDNSDEWRLKRAKGLQKYWPRAFKITHQYGRVKVKPSKIWKTFKQMPKGPGVDLNGNTLESFFENA